VRGEGGDVPLVSLQQFGNLHVLRLNPSTLFKHIFLQVFILLQTTQSQLEQPHNMASTICARRHQPLVGTCIILWMLWSITAASMLGEGPRVTNAAPGPSSRSLSSCEEIIGKQILLQLHLIPTARLLQLVRVPFFNCLASFPSH